MKLEIGTFKITKGDKEIELTAEEAKTLYGELNEHFGMILKSKIGDFAFNSTDGTMKTEFFGSKTFGGQTDG